MIIYSCTEHIEEALEECLEDGSLPPHMEKLAEVAEEKWTCFLCEAEADYKVEKND
ncbi:CxxH/CxxC protein [Paenalkalicoccus suaedae]|uniref:CxxH/CxxC protein n=1 Tax=Paenalkalicoccus suaedae TaxID=2592382 RepID=A0A859FJV5_9BACI|nr:CxxH/CxxC protein [Paenalkalicoccus suaedae]QKS73087.1 CxxH/CxxC protein [Paenalkalicoccus suaedae]